MSSFKPAQLSRIRLAFTSSTLLDIVSTQRKNLFIGISSRKLASLASKLNALHKLIMNEIIVRQNTINDLNSDPNLDLNLKAKLIRNTSSGNNPQ